MNILLLEKAVLTIGDLDFSELDALGSVTCYDNLMEAPAIIEAGLACGCEVLLCNKAPITEEVLSGLPDVKLVCVMATGYNNIDADAARRHGVTVCNVPGYSTDSVVQMIFSHLLAHAAHVAEYADDAAKGAWIASPTFSYLRWPVSEIAGKTMGVVGYGAIGKKTAAVAAAFGMKPLIHTRTQPADCPYPLCDRETLFRESDYIALCCPLNDGTKGMVNTETLGIMKPGAILINTARGPVVEEAAVADALRSGRLAGYGCDVLSKEPMQPDCPLYGAPNLTVTPHIAWATLEARERLLHISVNNIQSYFDGKPINRVV